MTSGTRKVASPLVCHYFRLLALSGANRVIHTLADCKRVITGSEFAFHNSCLRVLYTFEHKTEGKLTAELCVPEEAEFVKIVLTYLDLLIDVYGPDALISEFRPATPLELLATLS